MMKAPLSRSTLVAVLLLSFGCKPTATDSTSQVQTLDNLTRSEGEAVKENTCGIVLTDERYENLADRNKKKLDRIDANDRRLFLAASGTFMGIPKPLQRMFYAVDGKITVTDNASARCEDVELSPEEKRFVTENTGSLKSCWRRVGESVEIILPADEEQIRHSMLRMFSFLYYEYFFERLKRSGDRRYDDGVKKFEAQLTELSSALLADIAVGDQEVFEGFVALDQADSATFQKFVFAEAMDSYYCSPESRSIMADGYPKTMEAFVYGSASAARSGQKKGLANDFGKASFE